MKPGYVGVTITPRAQAAPVALAAQAATVLTCNATELRQAIEELMLTNPMVESVPLDSFEGYDAVGQAVARGETLSEHLEAQLRMSVRERALLSVCLYIANCLDKNGYFRDDLREVCGQCGCDEALALRALKTVQQMDPVGVGARDLSECLRLQLEEFEPVDPLAVEIVTSHLEELAIHDLHLPEWSDAEIQLAVSRILALDPRPGAAFDEEDIAYLIPDILVEEEQDSLRVCLMNQPRIPTLCSDNVAVAKIGNAEERKYMQQKLVYARSFLSAVQKRSRTLLSVAALAVEQQAAFFLEYPAASRRTLTLSMVAQALGLDVSTVSRAVKGKYVQYKSKVFPLRELFESGGTENASRQEILSRIAAICREHGDELSDQKISDALARQGISLARRTVNKYRKMLEEET